MARRAAAAKIKEEKVLFVLSLSLELKSQDSTGCPKQDKKPLLVFCDFDVHQHWRFVEPHEPLQQAFNISHFGMFFFC